VTRGERLWHSRAGTAFEKFKSCDGLREFIPNEKAVHDWEIFGSEKEPPAVTGENNFNFTLPKVADVAWSPHDPNVFVTVGGEDCPRDVRIWRRATHS
jgi:hypothetical protein